MKHDDVKIGMKVTVQNSKKYSGVYTVLVLPIYKSVGNYLGYPVGNYWVKLKKGFDPYIEVLVSDVEPYIEPEVEQPKFTWDTSVPTFGEPFKLNNTSWYIRVDGSKSALFDPPIVVKDISSNNFDSYKLCAIVSNSNSRFIYNEGYGKNDGSLVLPVTYTPKEREVTMKEVEEKFGCKIKIIAEV